MGAINVVINLNNILDHVISDTKYPKTNNENKIKTASKVFNKIRGV